MNDHQPTTEHKRFIELRIAEMEQNPSLNQRIVAREAELARAALVAHDFLKALHHIVVAAAPEKTGL